MIYNTNNVLKEIILNQNCKMNIDNKFVGLIFLAASILIILHHYRKHVELHGFERFFQIKDISNHETWATICFILFLVFYFY